MSFLEKYPIHPRMQSPRAPLGKPKAVHALNLRNKGKVQMHIAVKVMPL